MATENYPPLKIYELLSDEKQLIKEILTKAVEHGVCRLNDLTRQAEGVLGSRQAASLRHFPLWKTDEGTAKAGVLHSKWVFLYNYVMDILMPECRERQLTDITNLIIDLHHNGIRSGRYVNDMHVVNNEHMFHNTYDAIVDENCTYGPYIGFRYDSSSEDIILSVVNIKKENRYVFRSVLVNHYEGRTSGGFVYDLKGRLYLFGFLNDNQGAEYYAMRSDDPAWNILYGIMSIVNNEGVPHAKQTCFIRASIIYGVGNIDPDDRITSQTILNRAKNFFVGERIVKLAGRRGSLDIRRYLSEEIVRPRNVSRVPNRELGPSAASLRFDDHLMVVELKDGRTLGVPLTWFPRLLEATPEQREGYRISRSGESLHWEALEEDIFVPSLLAWRGDTASHR